MGYGLQAPFGNASLQDFLAQRRLRQMQEEAIARQTAQQSFQNQRITSQDDLAKQLLARKLGIENIGLMQGQEPDAQTLDRVPGAGGAPAIPGISSDSLGQIRLSPAQFAPQEVPGVQAAGVPSVKLRPRTGTEMARQEEDTQATALQRAMDKLYGEESIRAQFREPPKGLGDIEAEYAARARGTASVKPPPNDTPRLDRSYQVETSKLDKALTPVQQQVDRLSRLQESINQRTPAADALIAPELLTAMAGGMGSGLRMNEAEISRIVHGRSNWENLKAVLNRWKTDPSAALSVTDDQRQQMQDLVTAMMERLTKKVGLLNAAKRSMIDAASVDQHRQIVADTLDALHEIDTIKPRGGSEGGGSEWVYDPATGQLKRTGG